jgi:hypothetical protein
MLSCDLPHVLTTPLALTQEIIAELKVRNVASDDLTLLFFSDLVARQTEMVQSGDKQLGELLVSVEYSEGKGNLEVHVIQGRGLPIMDKAGTYGATPTLYCRFVTLYPPRGGACHVPRNT